MYLVRFKKTFSKDFRRDCVYLFDAVNSKALPQKDVDLIPYTDIQDFTGQNNLLLVRSGGIGDITAYSVLHDCANITFVTQGKYRPYLKLWKTPPKILTPAQPVFQASSIQSLINQIKHWGRLSNTIDAIELGSRHNWYDIIYTSAALPIGERRPQIVRPNAHPKEGTLIVHKSSVPNRNADLQTILSAIDTPYTIASEQTWTAEQFINAIASYEYLISTDTSAIHLREGFGLPGLGIYGTFHKDCRTSGHIYTHSIQSNRHCSPCQAHIKIPCKENTGQAFSPCLSGEDITQQIKEHYENRRKVQLQAD